MSKKIGIIIALAIAVCGATVGGAWWWVQQSRNGPAEVAAPVMDVRQLSYVTLEKVVVMLPTPPTRYQNYYLSADLVLRSDKVHEKTARADLPMLKAVALRTIAKIPAEQARAMSIEEWTKLLEAEFMDAYAGQLDLRPFDQVAVSRLIIE